MPEPTQNKTAGDKKPTKDNTREFAGMPIVIEWDEGDIRKGKTEEGKEWERIMAAPYGYILGTTGAGDKEGVDVYLGANENAPNVFVIEQLKDDGSFDEYKTMLGFDTLEEARDMYLKHYPKSWKENRLGEVATFPIEEFRQTVFQNQDKSKTAAAVSNLAGFLREVSHIDGMKVLSPGATINNMWDGKIILSDGHWIATSGLPNEEDETGESLVGHPAVAHAVGGERKLFSFGPVVRVVSPMEYDFIGTPTREQIQEVARFAKGQHRIIWDVRDTSGHRISSGEGSLGDLQRTIMKTDKEAGSQGDDVSQMFWTDPNAFSLTAAEKIVIGNACKLAITTEDREMIEALSGHVVDEAEVDDYELVLVGSDLLPDFYQIGMQRKGLSMADPRQQMEKQPGGLKTNWRETMAGIKAVVDRWLAEYGRLYAVSHSPEKQAQYVRLLKRLGYNIGEDVMELPGMNVQVPYIQKTAARRPAGWIGPVYHGAREWTDKIKNDKYTMGRFFSSDPVVAQAYGLQVFQAYLKMSKPFVVDAEGMPYDSIAVPPEMRDWVIGTMETVETDNVAEYAYKHGYDGVIIKNVIEPKHPRVADDYIVFNINQVKLIGPFEPKIDPILRSINPNLRKRTSEMPRSKYDKACYQIANDDELWNVVANYVSDPDTPIEKLAPIIRTIPPFIPNPWGSKSLYRGEPHYSGKHDENWGYRGIPTWTGSHREVLSWSSNWDTAKYFAEGRDGFVWQTVGKIQGVSLSDIITWRMRLRQGESHYSGMQAEWFVLNKLKAKEAVPPSKMAAEKPSCPHCGSKDYALMPTDFETAKCNQCGKNWDHGIVPGINDPSDAKTATVKTALSAESMKHGAWITTDGKEWPLQDQEMHSYGALRIGLASGEDYPTHEMQNIIDDALDTGAIRVFYRSGAKTLVFEMRNLDDNTRHLIKEVVSEHPGKRIVIESEKPPRYEEFDNNEDAIDWLENRTMMRMSALNKIEKISPSDMTAPILDDGTWFIGSDGFWYGMYDTDPKGTGDIGDMIIHGDLEDDLPFMKTEYVRAHRGNSYEFFEKPTEGQRAAIGILQKQYAGKIYWDFSDSAHSIPRASGQGSMGDFMRAVDTFYRGRKGKFSSWLLTADSPQLTPHRYEEFKPGTNGYALQPDRREGDAGLTMPALEDMAKKQDLNELQMVDGDKTIYPHRQGLPNAFEIHGAERIPGIPAGEEDVPGTVYLIHTDKPFHHLRHYLGWTSDLDARLEAHRSGQGANVMRVLKKQGIGWELARTWNNVTRKFERRLKNQGGLSRHCPVCKAQGLICPSRERVKALEAPEGVDYEVSCPVMKKGADVAAVVAGIQYWNDVYDCRRGECFGAIYATTEGGKGVLAGRLTYSIYDEEINVKMIETAPDVRRHGIGTKMVEKLKETYPDMKINWGMSTPEGTEFLKSVQGSKTASEIVPFYHGTSWEDAALIQKTGLRAHPWEVDTSKSFVWATVVPDQAVSYGKSKTDNNEFAVVEFYWDYDRSEADPEHGEYGDAYRRIPANIPMPMIHQITYFDPGGSIDHVWKPGKAASIEVFKFSSWMLLAANYEDMFKQLLAFEPKLKPDVKREIDWAKSTLRKSDRIVWYLRWVRLWFEYSLVFSQLAGFTESEDKAKKEQAKTILDKDIAAYNGKSPKTKITTEDTGNFTIRDLKRKLEHYFSLEGPEIEGFQLGYETPDQAFEQLEAAEDVIKERVQAEGRKIPEESMETEDVPFIKFGDGWVWWLLPRAYCPEEARAMGHCGNQPRSHTSDRILSLREPLTKGGKKYWVPHLTFVIDEKGFLGEMKGRGNDKPVKKYHPYIITILKDERIKGTKGATWYAENNFKLKDLTEEERQEIYDANPSFGGLSKKWKEYGINETIIEEIAERLNIDSEKFRPDWDAFVVRQWTSVKDCVSSIGEGDADEAAEWASMTDEQREREVAREHSRRRASLDDTEEVSQSVLAKCADNTIRNMVDSLRREVPDVIEEFKGVHAKYSGNPDWDLNNASDAEIADLLYITERETGFNTSVWTNIKAAFDKAVENDRRWALASDLEYELTSGMYERGDDIWTELRFGDDNKFKWDASPVYELIPLERAKELADPTNDYPEKKRNLEYGGELSVYISQENYESRDAEDLDDPFAILDAIYSGKMPQREDRRQFKLFEPPSKETVADIHEYLKENRLPEGKRLEEINTILAENAGKWDADQDYYAGEIIFDDDSGTYQMCTTPGKSGIEKPEFSRAGTLTNLNDESVVWKRVDRDNLADELHSMFINQALTERGRADREPEPAEA